MCGFMYVADSELELPVFEKEFERIAYRGPDMHRVEVSNTGIMGFHRLAIMGVEESGMQPMHLEGKQVVCNGEIYNFHRLREELRKKGYSFSSQSDCEVLLPLYECYGTAMFSMLDAEFACVIEDHTNGRIIAARDPIGIRPMFYGFCKTNGAIAFASEAKALHTLCAEVLPFPVGSYYDSGKFVSYCKPWEVKEKPLTDMTVAVTKIRCLLEAGVIKRLDADVPVGFLLSGGLDSSLVCAIAARHQKTPIQTFAIGMDSDPIDLRYAREAADYIGSDHHEFHMTITEVIEALPNLIRILETYDITTIRASLGMYLLCEKIKASSDVKVLLTGEISDELFGYKYTDFAPDAESFQRESEKRIKELYMYDVLRADRCISANALEARVPFGDLAFVRHVMRLDPAMKMNTYGKGKYLLRKAFAGKYLPETILMREKAAFSDAVGHSMVDELQAYAQKLYSDEDLIRGQECYAYHEPPISKESLLYRDLFEQFYPKRANWIKGFWMPNQEWAGCQVKDPSARVLSNYGESGK